MTLAAREPRLAKLRRELERTQDPAGSDYVAEHLSELREDALDAASWHRGSWVDVASLAVASAREAEFRLLQGQKRGWALLERSVRYWCWCIGSYPDKYFTFDGAVTLMTAGWLGRAEWADVVARQVEESVESRLYAPGHLIWRDERAGFVAFALWLCGPKFDDAADEQDQGEDVWQSITASVAAGRLEAAFTRACDAHLELSSDDVSFGPFPRGLRLMAPEIRLLAQMCTARGQRVDPAWHPLLGLPFGAPEPGAYDEAADPVMALIRESEAKYSTRPSA
jgi:hypothetical protein